MSASINRVTITGNLTRDPELRFTASGTGVCDLGVAVNGRRKDQSGEWVDKPNFFNVTVWGKQGENCAQYLQKGSGVAIDGRLEWEQWEAKDGSGKRSAVKIIAESVQFLSSGQQREDGFVPAASQNSGTETPQDQLAATPDAPKSGGHYGDDDDIPF